MAKRLRVLLQCSIPFAEDDWHVGRFSLLTQELERHADVAARNRELDKTGSDPVLRRLDRSDFDEIWILAVDGGEACTAHETAALNRFHRSGGGILTARDHQNMGLWLRSIEGPGSANFFHDPSGWEPDPERRARDDRATPTIDYPNYHSGKNGDVQSVTLVEPVHPLMRNPSAPSGCVERLPAHPHEGAVCSPVGEARARSVARGRSLVTGRAFDLVVAFDRAAGAPGRAIAESSFHHFADYNWDTSKGKPTFVTEEPGNAIKRDPSLLDDVRTYVGNCVRWLAPDAA
jgi:hypothetical protein